VGHVAYDPRSPRPRGWSIPSARTGYGAELPVAEESARSLLDVQDAARAGEIRQLQRKFLVSAVAACHDGLRHAGDRGATDAMRYLSSPSPCRWSAGRAVISIPGPGRDSPTTAADMNTPDRGRHRPAFLFAPG